MLWTVVLEKTLDCPLDCKEIKPINPKGNQSWIYTGRTDAESEAPILWAPDMKNWLIGKDPDAGKDWRQDQKVTTEDEVVGWDHQLHGHEFEQAPGVGDGHGGLVCCSPWGHKESDTTEWLNWTEPTEMNQISNWNIHWIIEKARQFQKNIWVTEWVKLLSHVQLLATLSTVAFQAPPSMGFSRQGYWNGLPFPSLEDLPHPGIKPASPVSPALQTDSLPIEPLGKPRKTSTSALLTTLKPLTLWITANCWKFFKRWEYQTPYLPPVKPMCRSKSNS